jgi:outer membrane protein assembly factor BamB
VSTFCGSCGAPTNPAARFCTGCGAAQPTASPQQPIPSQPIPSQPIPSQPIPSQPIPSQPVAAQTTRSRRTALIAGGAGLGVVALAGGIFAAVTLMGGDGDKDRALGRHEAVASAVTSEPSQAWEWRADDRDSGAYPRVLGDAIFVQDDVSGTPLMRLSTAGEEMWTNDDAAGVSFVDVNSDRVYAWTEWEDLGFAVLDLDSGETLWQDDDWNIASLLDDGLLHVTAYDYDMDQSSYGVMDKDGEVLWQQDWGSWTEHGGSLYRHDGDTVARIDARTGEVEWEVDTEVEIWEEWDEALAVNGGIVAMSGSEEVVALDPETGEELWREDGLYDFGSVESFGTTLVTISRSGDSDSWTDGEQIFFNRDGIVERKPLDPDESSLYGYDPFILDGTTYVPIDGIIYDEALDLVTSYDGTIAPAGKGYYQLLNGELSFHELEGKELWARQVGDSDSSQQIDPLPGMVIVSDGETITAYK